MGRARTSPTPPRSRAGGRRSASSATRADALAAAVASAAGGWAASLTAAELRLLPLLTTHLTFAEIGQRLHISRNTVKTEAISVYRKLGASNRSEAIERATGAGLIDEGGSRGLGDITRTG